jgi:hypothetical protein
VKDKHKYCLVLLGAGALLAFSTYEVGLPAGQGIDTTTSPGSILQTFASIDASTASLVPLSYILLGVGAWCYFTA